MRASSLARAGCELLVVMSLAATQVFADSSRTFIRNTGNGSAIVTELSNAPSAPGSNEGLRDPDSRRDLGSDPLRDLEVLWHRHYDDATYTTAALCPDSGVVAAGTYLNPPKEVEVIPVAGDGTPDWTFGGTEFYVDASKNGTVVAAVDYDQAAFIVTLRCWEAGSSVPLWSYTVSPAQRGSNRTVAVSADGSTIALLVTMQETSAARLYLFRPESSTPIGIFDGPGGFGRNLSIGADGRFAAFIGLATAYVVDRDLGVLRWSGSMTASSDPIAISTDGQYLAFGWTSLRMLRWSGTAYSSLWTVAGGNYGLGPCVFSGDGSTFVAGWYRTSFDQNRVQVYAPSSSTPLATYLYPQSGGAYQDIPSDIAVTPDGQYVLVGSWGDQLLINDEVQLFGRDLAGPKMTLDTPGSVFDVDLVRQGPDLIITACGKAVHANQQGRGGDLYALRFREPAGVPLPGRPPAQAMISFGSLPNPFRSPASLEFLLREPCLARVELYSAGGQQVRVLAAEPFSSGWHSLVWDGLDAHGRPAPAGAYLFRITAGREQAGRRAILIH
jgi:hypothetical protein